MVKSSSINQAAEELRESILTTTKKQRRIRSGTFWNRFRFERRTKERVEAVKAALAERKIEFNLEDAFFGVEKRGEVIIFRIASDQPPINDKKKTPKGTPSLNLRKIGDPAFESVHKYDRIEAKLRHLTEVTHFDFHIELVFSELFVELFWNETPNYELPDGSLGATRSNWTYHTAIAIAQACKILDLTCRFEAHGKRDAIIETSNPPGIILAAEWEWDYMSIFGKGKELDKLKSTCRNNPTASAFLLVYCPNSKYLDYLERIAEDWILDPTMKEQAPTLYLHTVIFEEKKGGNKQFLRLKTVMIHNTGIDVWGDRYL
jgi:hypothetical protein